MSGPLVGSRLVRVRHESGVVAVGVVADGAIRVLSSPSGDVVSVLSAGRLPPFGGETIPLVDGESLTVAAPWTLVAPIVPPETWAAGVTYERSREARMHESEVVDVYALVYEARRPELFMKDAGGRRTVGPGEPIGVRSDAVWSVPEPELAVVLGEGGTPLAVTVGNDVSSRDIEGENPLYLPQAKIFAGSCALGPALLVPRDWEAQFEIVLRIFDVGGVLRFESSASTASMRRSIGELVSFLSRDNPLAAGTVLLTGTGIVPPDDVSLAPGQTVEIRIAGIGTLRNPVAAASEIKYQVRGGQSHG